ncbi:MAG: hypothetical protein HOC74_22160 [Gemmatimonadetes bacterium]|jgi:hypothetical protein|nr:hypothetical protein [Gemmatimonadota bacterium]
MEKRSADRKKCRPGRLLGRLLVAVVGIFLAIPAWGCEIEVKTKGAQKEVYAEGEELVLAVEVFLTHKDCPEGIKATKYQTEGLKILGATPWKETSPGRFVRFFKVSVTSAQGGEGAFHARRKCEKEGGYGMLKLGVPAAPAD